LIPERAKRHELVGWRAHQAIEAIIPDRVIDFQIRDNTELTFLRLQKQQTRGALPIDAGCIELAIGALGQIAEALVPGQGEYLCESARILVNIYEPDRWRVGFLPHETEQPTILCAFDTPKLLILRKP
jgi:hypothetical protein